MSVENVNVIGLQKARQSDDCPWIVASPPGSPCERNDAQRGHVLMQRATGCQAAGEKLPAIAVEVSRDVHEVGVVSGAIDQVENAERWRHAIRFQSRWRMKEFPFQPNRWNSEARNCGLHCNHSVKARRCPRSGCPRKQNQSSNNTTVPSCT